MTTERIEEIQLTTGYPDSVSVQQALLQVWNEVEQESNLVEAPVSPMLAEWISVKDKLPPEADKMVIGEDAEWIVTDCKRVWIEKIHPAWWERNFITYWKDKPEPPKQ